MYIQLFPKEKETPLFFSRLAPPTLFESEFTPGVWPGFPRPGNLRFPAVGSVLLGGAALACLGWVFAPDARDIACCIFLAGTTRKTRKKQSTGMGSCCCLQPRTNYLQLSERQLLKLKLGAKQQQKHVTSRQTLHMIWSALMQPIEHGHDYPLPE